LGISSFEAQERAQKLYEKGYITYPRTENTLFPEEYCEESKSVMNKLKKGFY
jgi:DNA topoisomerase IA